MSNISDPDKSVSNLYALEGGEKYTVEISSSATADSTYTLTVEQDNWVFAPEGGVQEYDSFPFGFLGDYERNMYVPTTAIETIVREKVSREDGIDAKFEIENYHDLKYTFELLNLSQADGNKLSQYVGVGTTIIGGIFAVIPPGGLIVALIGNTLSLVSVATLIDWDGNVNVGDLADITNVEINIIYADSRYGNFGLDYSVLSELKPWSLPKYINRYESNQRTTINTKTSSVELGEYCGWLK